MKTVDKPWGKEIWIEVNESYAMKKLCMNAGHQCSIQYHEKKKETFYMLKGECLFFHGPSLEEITEILMKEGDSFTVEPGMVHRMRAVTDIEYLEASSPELEDVVRLEDNYGRI